MQNRHANLVAILSCLAVGVVLEAKLPTSYAKRTAPGHYPLISIPYHLGPFSGREAHGRDIRGYPGEIHCLYRQAGANAIELIAAPTADNHAPENCLPYIGWSIIERGHRTLKANPPSGFRPLSRYPTTRPSSPLPARSTGDATTEPWTIFLTDWLHQRSATVTQSLQNAELVSVCTSMDDVRQAGPAIQRVYVFANDLEPYFNHSSLPAVGSLSQQMNRP